MFFTVSVCSCPNGKYGFITVNLLEFFKRLLYNFSLNMFYCLLRSFVITINFWKNICTFLLYYCSLTLKSESSGRMTYFFLGIFRPSTLAISFIWGNLFGNTLFFSITPYHFIHLSREIHISIKQKKYIYICFAVSELILVLGRISGTHNPVEENRMSKGCGTALWGFCYRPVRREELSM